MGASISLDSKYRLVLNTEVECISINPSSSSAVTGGASGGAHKKKHDHKRHRSESESDSDGSGSDSGSGSGSGSNSERSDSDSDSDSDKTYTVKLTPEIIGYIRSYIRKNQFLDEFDLITEIELDKYEHAPGSALVFNSDSIVFMTNNHTLEAVGDWEYIEPEKPVVTSSKSKSKGGRGRDRDRRRDDNDDNDDNDDDNNYERKQTNYKTKEDDLPVNEIESILTEKFEEYNKTREFVIHESKNSFLVLLIKSVEIVKA
jgi:hypothetical protein